ncbi:MAG: 2-C-methyl-D-erythritol 4-phosphate cytidylyltransferase [Acidimicrobiales bacterium]
MAGSVWAIVVAAGKGTRYGGPKQFAVVGDRTVVELAVGAVAGVAKGVVVVIPADLQSGASRSPADLLGGLAADLFRTSNGESAVELRVVTGRESRAGSVRAGLEAVPGDCEVVVVHDAARPLASPLLCRQVVEAVLAGADAAIPGIAVTDTVKRVRSGEVVETLARDSLIRVQTPQAFRAAVLRRAHLGEPEATDDSALVEALGGTIVVLPGEETNLKITSPTDLQLLELWHHKLLAEAKSPSDTELSR